MQLIPASVASENRHQAIALIGAELIAYRVNRTPEQYARLLGLALMADTLGVLSITDRATLVTMGGCFGVVTGLCAAVQTPNTHHSET